MKSSKINPEARSNLRSLEARLFAAEAQRDRFAAALREIAATQDYPPIRVLVGKAQQALLEGVKL